MTAVIADGVVIVDKPRGLTSFDVVRKVRRAAGLRRVGHGGTLDPLASGVLPVCLGEATKLARFLLDADKEYEVTACFGVETDTFDADGAITRRCDASALREGDVRAALPALTGEILQVPPAYSAIKRDGRPLYAYARAGQAVETPPRRVRVHELELSRWDGPEAVSLRVRCAKGTYVRSLVADLGRGLGVGAHVTALRRTRSGPFSAAGARPLADVLAALADRRPEAAAPALLTLDAALGHLPRCFADEASARDIAHGRRVAWGALRVEAAAPGTFHRVLRPDGTLLAVAVERPDGSVGTLRVFLPPRAAAGRADNQQPDNQIDDETRQTGSGAAPTR